MLMTFLKICLGMLLCSMSLGFLLMGTHDLALMLKTQSLVDMIIMAVEVTLAFAFLIIGVGLLYSRTDYNRT